MSDNNSATTLERIEAALLATKPEGGK